jgi:8-oxo-dGTP pyrophosphatase MutT (NUDIX family)
MDSEAMEEKNDNELIKAAGGLVWVKDSRIKKVAIVHRTRYGSEWTLPKGKLEMNETWKQAAKREVSEEIGCEQSNLRITSFAGGTVYPVEGKPKIVLFWNMTLEGDYTFGKTDSEVNQVEWLPVEKALELLKHPKEKLLLKENMFDGEGLFDEKSEP